MSERRGGGGQSKNSELDRWCCSSENHGNVSPNRLLFFPLPMKTLIQLTIPQSLAIDASIIFDQSGLKTLKYRKKEADFRYVFDAMPISFIHSFLFFRREFGRKTDFEGKKRLFLFDPSFSYFFSWWWLFGKSSNGERERKRKEVIMTEEGTKFPERKRQRKLASRETNLHTYILGLERWELAFFFSQSSLHLLLLQKRKWRKLKFSHKQRENNDLEKRWRRSLFFWTTKSTLS